MKCSFYKCYLLFSSVFFACLIALIKSNNIQNR
nr:MAG TPA: hypothetical protein [Caudoviricetes sp.]